MGLQSDEYYRAANEVAESLGADVSDLILALYVESGVNQWAANRDQRKNADGSWVNPDPENPTKGYPLAVGQNQIMWGRWQAMGYSNEADRRALLKLTPLQGLRYVRESFKSVPFPGPYVSATQFYLANFAPAYLTGKWVDAHRTPSFIVYPENSAAYRQNAGINQQSGDGGITIADLMGWLGKHAQSEGYRAHLARLRTVLGKPALEPSTLPRDGSPLLGPGGAGAAGSVAAKRGFGTVAVLGLMTVGVALGSAVAWWEVHR